MTFRPERLRERSRTSCGPGSKASRGAQPSPGPGRSAGEIGLLPKPRRRPFREELARAFSERFLTFLEEHCDRLADFERRRIDARTAEDDRLALAMSTRIRDYFQMQKLVDLFVRSGLVPSYSLPVDTVRLEISTRPSIARRPDYAHLAAGQEIDLVREAQLAISEYAPGAEVVAAGRIRTSSSIARYRAEYEQ